MSNFGFQRLSSEGSSRIEKLLDLIERFSPLLFGLAVGAFLVMIFGRFPTKWVTFIVFAAIVGSIMILVMTLTNRTRETLLFSAIPTLPLMYSITIGYRENVSFSVMANGFPIELFDIALFSLLVGWLYQLWIKVDPVSLYFPKKWTALMLALLVINVYSALYVARENFFSFSMIYSQLKCYLIIFFIANYIRDRHSLRLLGYAFAAILITQGLIVMEQLFLGVIFTAENLGRNIALQSAAGMETINRVAGTLGHPNNMAMYLDLIIPWVGFQLMSEKIATRRVYLGIALFLGLFAVLASGSRGAWLGLLFGCFIAILLWYRKQGKSPVTALFILFISLSLLFVTLFAASNTFRTRLTSDDQGAAQVRVPLMEVATEIISAKPLEGVGLANYTKEMLFYDRTTTNVAAFYDQPVHNTFLLMAAETGVLSALLFIGILIMAIRSAYLLAMKSDGEFSALGFGLLASLPGWFIHNQVNHTAPFIESTLWLLMGLLLAAQNQVSRQQSFREKST
jgi:O-antigen ligase